MINPYAHSFLIATRHDDVLRRTTCRPAPRPAEKPFLAWFRRK